MGRGGRATTGTGRRPSTLTTTTVSSEEGEKDLKWESGCSVFCVVIIYSLSD